MENGLMHDVCSQIDSSLSMALKGHSRSSGTWKIDQRVLAESPFAAPFNPIVNGRACHIVLLRNLGRTPAGIEFKQGSRPFRSALILIVVGDSVQLQSFL
jgi:hypothetical protein